LQKHTRSILDELDSLTPNRRDQSALIESRATHVIQGAINLINHIKEVFDQDTAGDLERRLLNSIRAQDPAKFTRGIRKTRNENQ
jgi:hypothetical protein